MLLLVSLAVAAPARHPAHGAAPGTGSADVDLLLAVVVNGHAIDLVGNFKERDGKLFATSDELKALGFRLSGPAASATPSTELPLGGLGGVSYRLDRSSQTLYLIARPDALKPNTVDFEDADAARKLPAQSGLGVVANYNLIGTEQNGHAAAEGLLDARGFSPWGVAASSFLGNVGVANVSPLVRLDTTYSYSDPDNLRRYRLGDVITGGLAWSRPVRMAGIQVTTDFSIRPDLVTFPVPTISGQVAVPSSVDVLVNGVQLLSRNLPPGPFEIRQLPIVTGSGDVTVVVRNALGQDTTQTLPVYTSSQLLAPGLSAFSAEIGVVRLNYGVASDDYQTPAATVSYRRGLLNWLTLEGHGEGSGSGSRYDGTSTRAGGMAGGGAAFTVSHLGVVSLDVAMSRFGSGSGKLASVSYQRIGGILSLAGSIQIADPQFGDIASTSGDPTPTLQAQASIGLSFKHLGSFGIAYVGVRRPPDRAAQGPYDDQQAAGVANSYNIPSLQPATQVKLLSASYSRQILRQRAYFYATAFHDFADGSNTGMMIGISIPLGRRSSAGASISDNDRHPSATFEASQGASTVGDIGWQVQADADDPGRQLADGEYKSPWALVDAGFDRIAGQTTLRGTVQGALAYTDHALFASNTISDSFAVVDTDKAEGIEVLQENRPVGRTGPSGLMLVPDLSSFQANHVGIDPVDVPMDAEISQTSRLVRPQDHSGVVVHFPVHFSHGAVVRLVDAAGVAIPVGSSARLAVPAGTAEVEVGYDGEAFVTGLDRHDTLTVLRPDGRRCTATFDYQPKHGILPEIGPVPCRMTPE